MQQPLQLFLGDESFVKLFAGFFRKQHEEQSQLIIVDVKMVKISHGCNLKTIKETV